MSKIFACSANEVDVSTVPTQIKILPLGMVKSRKGEFLVDEESFKLITKHYTDRQLDLVVDYEHQTLMGTQAPAGGWIKSLSLGEDAIVANVEWTDRAAEYLKNKEYRYLSPVVMVRSKDNRAVALQSVALTNVPAIDGMFAVVNSAASLLIDTQMDGNEEGECEMDLKKLAKILGLPEDVSEEAIDKAIAELLSKVSGDEKKEEEKTEEDKEAIVANNTILSLLQLKADAKTEEVVASILGLKSPEATMQLQIEELSKKMAKRDAEEMVMTALKEGKIAANQKDWAIEYALKDAKGFQNFASMATQVVPIGKLSYDATEKKNVPQEVDQLVLKNLGFDDAEISKMVASKGV